MLRICHPTCFVLNGIGVQFFEAEVSHEINPTDTLTWSGGEGLSGISYFGMSQLTDNGKRAHGAVLSISAIIRTRYEYAVSRLFLVGKWRRRRDDRGFCQAHSKRSPAICDGKPCTNKVISQGPRLEVLVELIHFRLEKKSLYLYSLINFDVNLALLSTVAYQRWELVEILAVFRIAFGFLVTAGWPEISSTGY